jgi:hypothetical protein
MGPQPVVRNLGGQELVYTIWRNGLTCSGSSNCDGREDATMGEMVLDGSTVSGYQAGDVRFIAFEDIQTDEMMQVTMAGDTVFHNHWMLSEARTITDRSASRGSSFTNPIQSAAAPYVIWRQASGHGCTFNASTRYCTSLYSYGDTRSYNVPGFYEYFDAQQGGSRPYSIVSAGQVIVKTGDGGLMVFESGNPTASAATDSQLVDATSTFDGLDGQLASVDALESRPSDSAQVPGLVSNAPTGADQVEALISYEQAPAYFNRTVSVEGVLASAVDHRPKAVYLGFTDPHDGALLVRIFERDLANFTYDPLTLAGKRIRVTGKVTYYWPDGVDPEIIVTDPSQITVIGDESPAPPPGSERAERSVAAF